MYSLKPRHVATCIEDALEKLIGRAERQTKGEQKRPSGQLLLFLLVLLLLTKQFKTAHAVMEHGQIVLNIIISAVIALLMRSTFIFVEFLFWIPVEYIFRSIQ